MRVKNLLFIFFFLLAVDSFSQSLSKEFVDMWIKSRDTSFRWNERTLYIVNKKQYEDDTKIDSGLKKLSLNDLIDIRYLMPSIGSNPPINYIITIDYKRQMGRKIIASYLKKIKNFTVNKTKVDNTDFYLNNKYVEMNKVDSLINSIKITDIYCIDVIELPYLNSYFGESRTNDLVRIWTKN
ncbi:MAG TPA: hypothetical protein VF487_19660 [Chitinophagaceae bacterium]